MRKKCIVCGSNFYPNPLFVCKNMPAESQNLPSKDMLKYDKTMDLRLMQCCKCGLVQFDCKPVTYYKDSTRAMETSVGLRTLREKNYRYLIEKYNLQGKKIIEIGAGKGGFLRPLKDLTQYSVAEYGLEYNDNFVSIARTVEGVNVIQGDPENSNLIINDGPFDAFVSFSYPARLLKPNNMLEMISNNLVESGIGYMLVPNFEHLLRKDGLFDVVRDLIAYYSIDNLRFLCEKNNFEVLEYGTEEDFYNYVICKKRQQLDIKSYWSEGIELIEEIKGFIETLKDNGKRIAVWCAGHFAFTVLSISGIAKDIEYIIDNATFKQGLFAPGSQIPIYGPEYYKKDPVDVIIVLRTICVDEIKDEIIQKCSSDIQVITIDKNGIHEI